MNSTGIRPKVVGAVGGVTLGGAIATLVVWIIGLNHIVVPPEVAVAMAAIFSAILAAVGGYATPSPYVLPDTTSVTTTVTTPPKGQP